MSGSSLFIFPRGKDQLPPLYALTRIHYHQSRSIDSWEPCRSEDSVPSPNSRLEEFLPRQELVVCTSRNPQILLHDFHYIPTTKDNDQIYILRTFSGSKKVNGAGSVRGQSLRRTNVLVRFGNIFGGLIPVLLMGC